MKAKLIRNLAATALLLLVAGNFSINCQINIVNQTVGIGTNSPSSSFKLDVKKEGWKAKFHGTDGYIYLGPANSSWAHIYTDRPYFIFNKGIYAMGGVFSTYSTSNMYLRTNGNTRVTINYSNGNVGIGKTASSGYKLDVAGVINTTHYYTESDARFKKDIKTYSGTSNDLYKLRPVSYKLKNYPKITEFSSLDTIPGDSIVALGLPSTGISGKQVKKTVPYDSRFKEKHNRERQEIGFLAQEIQEIYPDLVMSNDQGYLSVNYIGLIPIMVANMKEQQTIIEEQNEKIKKLEEEHNSQQSQLEAQQAEIELLKKQVEQLLKQ